MSDKIASKSKFQTLFAGDRATAPSALELDSPSAWALFEQGLSRSTDAPAFEDTLPSTEAQPLRAAAAGWQHTQPLGNQRLPVPPATPRPISLDDVLAVARRLNRACPQQAEWQAMTAVLARAPVPAGLPPPPPALTGNAWHAASPMQKRLRLRDQAEWAAAAGPAVLRTMHSTLVALRNDQWLHFETE